MTEIEQQISTESGRSMVEMLGTLAIIGVLSIGGIAGYNLGMEKQRANELLEASLQRAYTVSAQILSGRNASLAEFNKDTQKAGGTFQEDVEEQYLGEIGIKIHAVNQNVCKALVRSITDTSPLRGIAFTGTETDITEADCQESNDLTLYYNDDMSMTENNRDNAGGNDGLCPDGLPKCGEQCCAEGTYCAQGANTSTYTCATATGNCTKNSDCADNQYCKFSGGDCTGPTGGTCTAKGTLSSTTLELGKGDLTVYKGSYMNWWSAKNFCQAHGKQLVTMADLGLSDQEGKTYCYFDYSKTTDVTLQCACAGDEGCTQTASTTGLYAIGNSGLLWLADNSKTNSCRARYVGLGNGHVNSYNRHLDGPNYYALCR